MKLSQDFAHPVEGELMVAALADETYAVLQRRGGRLIESLSGEEVAPVEIIAAAELEAWPFDQAEPVEVGDDVSVELPAKAPLRAQVFDMGRVLHTHGSEAWVRLIGGESLVVSMSRLRLLPK